MLYYYITLLLWFIMFRRPASSLYLAAFLALFLLETHASALHAYDHIDTVHHHDCEQLLPTVITPHIQQLSTACLSSRYSQYIPLQFEHAFVSWCTLHFARAPPAAIDLSRNTLTINQ